MSLLPEQQSWETQQGRLELPMGESAQVPPALPQYHAAQ